MTFWQAFKAGFGFLSVIPVGITMEGIEALMKRLYLYPVVGLCLGLFIGFFSLVAQNSFTVAADRRFDHACRLRSDLVQSFRRRLRHGGRNDRARFA